MGGMEEREKQSGTGAATFAIVSLLAAIPILYVLLAGPVLRLVGEDTWRVIYFPLILLARLAPPLGRAIEWYVRLWI
jgi:hypothetical protein